MNALAYILSIHNFGAGGFWSIENPNSGKASNSEIRRWFKNKSVIINDVAVETFDLLPEELTSVVLFPKSAKKKITIL